MDGVRKETLDVLQADLDDESPQTLGALIGRLLEAGALDAHLTPLVMKKNRPGCRIELLCSPEDREKFLELLFRETTTLGVKARSCERYALARRFEEIHLEGCRIRLKIASLDGEDLRAVPEFEDCKAAADSLGRPLRDVIEQARSMGRALLNRDE